MNLKCSLKVVATAVLVFLSIAREGVCDMKDYPIQPIEFTSVRFEDGFWSPRLETNRTVTLPANFKKSEETGRISNFAKAGGLMEGKHEGIFFNDSDVFKIVEGAAYTLALQPDAALDKYLDELIALFTAAQEDDGYLYTARTIDPENAPPVVGKERWENIRVAHELYNVGHMYEAAIAHFLATGKRTFLEVAVKNADLICRVFGPGRKYAVPGHEEIEIGLVKLYRVTGNQAYLDMARFFIEQRGNPENRELFGDYCQDHKPLVAQDEAVGHAVRAGYFYAGATDVAAITGNSEYVAALDQIWKNMVGKKMYLTGGIGARRQGEQFGANYELPNDSAYAETCAAIANILWNRRMFLLKGESKYIDVLERALYNGFLSGISLTGDAFFYVNPLSADGSTPFNHGSNLRQPWFNCSCCPTNIVRFLPSLSGYVYAVRDDTVYINLYGAGRASFQFRDMHLSLEQRTEYPWDGNIQIAVTPEKPSEFELRLRVPCWALGKPMPEDLYHYENKTVNAPVRIRVNGTETPEAVDADGYVSLRRTWSGGDLVTLELPMQVRYVFCHEAVEQNLGRIAVECGPIVYCAEGADNGGKVGHRFLPPDTLLEPREEEILPGTVITALTGQGGAVYQDAQDQPERIEEEPITLIPYYAWAHRGPGEMQVWIARNVGTARTAPIPTLASSAEVSVSHVFENDTPRALNDQKEPDASNDTAIARFTWWPHKGSREWVQYDFKTKTTVGKASVYWFDDTPDGGGCRVPAKWRLEYLQNETWIPVSNSSDYTTVLNQYNDVSFTPVKTKSLRLLVRLQREYSAGILEWKLTQ
ncbi:MAG TPA: glycoside hydrolase family 127 protein [Candidatus Hydrogenedentes bacterium]|nr:glycoside hydrolase family 127 protein [Candidatus Hydrogenedentota bacterium]